MVRIEYVHGMDSSQVIITMEEQLGEFRVAFALDADP